MRNINGLLNSFKNAFVGILYCVRTEPNMMIHGIATILVVTLAWWLHLDQRDWLILLLTIVSVVVAEMFNTAIETVVDLVSPDFHPLAKIAKDVAAGAVLVTAGASLVVGYVLLWSKL